MTWGGVTNDPNRQAAARWGGVRRGEAGHGPGIHSDTEPTQRVASAEFSSVPHPRGRQTGCGGSVARARRPAPRWPQPAPAAAIPTLSAGPRKPGAVPPVQCSPAGAAVAEPVWTGPRLFPTAEAGLHPIIPPPRKHLPPLRRPDALQHERHSNVATLDRFSLWNSYTEISGLAKSEVRARLKQWTCQPPTQPLYFLTPPAGGRKTHTIHKGRDRRNIAERLSQIGTGDFPVRNEWYPAIEPGKRKAKVDEQVST